MPLVLLAACSYAAGLLVGFGGALLPALLASGIGGAIALRRRDVRLLALCLVAACGALSAELARRDDARCMRRLAASPALRIALDDDARAGSAARGTVRDGRCRLPALVLTADGGAPAGAVARVAGRVVPSPGRVVVQQAHVRDSGERALLPGARARARAAIARRFGRDAPLALALLVAETREIPGEVRDRFAASGLVHVLSVSGLHVSIVARAALLLLAAARLSPRAARMWGLALTGAYVVLLGVPPPAVRAAVMLAAADAAVLLQRPTSPWAGLALGAAVPLLLDPRDVLDLGWQLSVSGMASLVASGMLVRRVVTPRLSGWRAALGREMLAGTLATLVTAPLVALAFARVSLAGPLSNLAAAPVVAVLQPALFLAMLLEPVPPAAALVADATRPLLAALDAIAAAFAAVPGVAPVVAPSALTAALLGAAAVALVVACSADAPARAIVVGAAFVAAAAWGSVVRPAPGALEVHMLDVGQGDALALRTPAGRWVLFDAGRSWRGGDAALTTIIPFLRRRGGDVVALVLSHPHTDHVGGAASLLRALRPGVLYDAAFAGDAQAYRDALAAADSLGLPWQRVRPGDSLVVDGAVVRFLAPDSSWTASLDDPNLASTVVRVDFGVVRFLLTGDAEAPEEAWLLARDADALRADVLKVAHHGSRTSSGDAFLDAVRPRVALVSVGLGNSYGHPGGDVMAALARRGAQVLRSDELGAVIVHTDGRTLEIEAYGVRWAVSAGSPD